MLRCFLLFDCFLVCSLACLSLIDVSHYWLAFFPVVSAMFRHICVAIGSSVEVACLLTGYSDVYPELTPTISSSSLES